MKVTFSRKVMLTELEVPTLIDGQASTGTAHVMWYLQPSFEGLELTGLECCLTSVHLPAYPSMKLTNEQKDSICDLIREYHRKDFEKLFSPLTDESPTPFDVIN